MNATFPVDRKRIFKSLTLFMSFAITAPLTLLMIVRYVSSGFNYNKTFEHLSLPILLLILVCIPVFSAVFSLLIALWFGLAAITINEGTIYGRDYWGRKNRIPLTDITKLTPFSNNGINAIVVNSNYHGQIHISDTTERLNELLTILDEYLPSDQKITTAEADGRGNSASLRSSP